MASFEYGACSLESQHQLRAAFQNLKTTNKFDRGPRVLSGSTQINCSEDFLATCHIRTGQYLAKSHVEISFQSSKVLN